MSEAIDSLHKRLKKDTTWKSFKSIVEMAYPAEFENFGAEALRLHKTRQIRVLKRGKASRLQEAALNDQATRSRLVEIAVTVIENKNGLSRAIQEVQEYIETHYESLLTRKGCKTVTARKAIIKHLVKNGRNKLEQMETLVEIVDRVIDDVDQAGFAIKHSVDLLGLATKREFAS